MTRYRPTSPALIVFLLVAAAVVAFAAVRYVQAQSAVTLPAVTGDVGDAAARPGALDPATLYAAASPSVVTIDATFDPTGAGEPEPMRGTGFVVDRGGTIVTASHVVVDYFVTRQHAASIFVTLASGDRIPGRVMDVDTSSDIAILRVDPAAVANAAPLAFGDSDRLVVGAPVAVIGAPFGMAQSLSTGIVSALDRTVDSKINASSRIPDMVQSDAAVNEGTSGGPLLDARGQVVGMAQQIYSTTGQNSGVSYFVSSNLVRAAVDRFTRTGSVASANLGLEQTTTTVTSSLAAEYDLPARAGALVAAAQGPAKRAGLTAGRAVVYQGSSVVLGDQIVSIAGIDVVTADDVATIARRLDPGVEVPVVFFRGGARHTTRIVTATRI